MKGKAENVIFSSETDEWGTPNDLFIKLDKKYNFTLDVSASDTNYKCKNYYTKEDNAKLIVLLIPVRTDTKYFHKYIYNKAELIFIKGRLKFTNPNKSGSAPFPSMLVIFKEKLKLDNQIQLF